MSRSLRGLGLVAVLLACLAGRPLAQAADTPDPDLARLELGQGKRREDWRQVFFTDRRFDPFAAGRLCGHVHINNPSSGHMQARRRGVRDERYFPKVEGSQRT